MNRGTWDKLKRITVEELKNDIQFVKDDELEQQIQMLKTIQHKRKVKRRREEIYASLKSWHVNTDKVTVHMNQKTAEVMFVDVTKDGEAFRFSKKMCIIKHQFYLACNEDVLWVGVNVTSNYPMQTVKYDWINADMTRTMFLAVMS